MAACEATKEFVSKTLNGFTSGSSQKSFDDSIL